MGQFTNTGNGSVLIPDAPDPNPQDNKVTTPSSQTASKAGDITNLDAAVNAGGSQIVHPADIPSQLTIIQMPAMQ